RNRVLVGVPRLIVPPKIAAIGIDLVRDMRDSAYPIGADDLFAIPIPIPEEKVTDAGAVSRTDAQSAGGLGFAVEKCERRVLHADRLEPAPTQKFRPFHPAGLSYHRAQAVVSKTVIVVPGAGRVKKGLLKNQRQTVGIVRDVRRRFRAETGDHVDQV